MRRHRTDPWHAGNLITRKWGTALLCTLLFGIAATRVSAAPAAGLSPSTFKQLETIHGLMDKQAYDQAFRSLSHMLADNSLRSYEKAVILQTLGHVQISRQSYFEAARAFEESLALKQLPVQTQQSLRYALAQLYLATDEPARSANILEDWLSRAENPPAEAYALLGNAYAQQRQYRKAIPPLRRAIELAHEARPDWYEALLAMHYELQSYRACIPLLENMLRLFPERGAYWQQLAGVHLALDDHGAALTALELAYRDGALQREQQLVQLAQLYIHTGVPYKAARLVAEQVSKGGISDNAQNRELLARAWSDAREREQAILALQQAIESDSSPELRLRLAHWYLEGQRWQATVRVLQPLAGEATADAGARAGLLLGIAHYELGELTAARQALLDALQSGQSRSAAQQWLEFLDGQTRTTENKNRGEKKAGRMTRLQDPAR